MTHRKLSISQPVAQRPEGKVLSHLCPGEGRGSRRLPAGESAGTGHDSLLGHGHRLQLKGQLPGCWWVGEGLSPTSWAGLWSWAGRGGSLWTWY